MMEHHMKQNLFRKESMERISSPDELHDYMRVTSPRLWMVLTLVIVLLAGFIVYASVSRMENTLDVKAEIVTTYESVDDNKWTKQQAYLNIPPEKMDIVQTGMKVRIVGTEGTIMSKIQSGEDFLAEVLLPESAEKLPEGICDAQIVLESVSPLSFLLNGG